MGLLLFEIFLLILGFVVLIKSADLFVDSISSIATNFKMSKMTIALTVAAFGTCAPEIAISFNSILAGNGDMAMSNVIGSCIVNTFLIIGIAALCFPIKVQNSTVKKELPILVTITTVFAFQIAVNIFQFPDGMILSRINSVILILVFCFFLYLILKNARKSRFWEKKEKPKYGLVASILISVFCIGCIILGSNMVVDYATLVAQHFNVSEKIITMTVIVIGTSLPELTMTVLAARKKEFDIAVGNIIGTNIFNIGVVLGLPVLLLGNIYAFDFNIIDVIALLLTSLVLFMFARSERTLSRIEGLVMILIFVSYYTYILLV